MWPRTSEVMIGFWLAASPFIFRHAANEPGFWWNDMGSAFLVITFSLFSFGSRTTRAHMFNIVIALWLIVVGYLWSPAVAGQNDLVTGLILLMLAIIPSEATLPPRGWTEFNMRAKG